MRCAEAAWRFPACHGPARRRMRAPVHAQECSGNRCLQQVVPKGSAFLQRIPLPVVEAFGSKLSVNADTCCTFASPLLSLPLRFPCPPRPLSLLLRPLRCREDAHTSPGLSMCAHARMYAYPARHTLHPSGPGTCVTSACERPRPCMRNQHACARIHARPACAVAPPARVHA
eukprot:153047-Chlamydomonas_euryale.AAC.17